MFEVETLNKIVRQQLINVPEDHSMALVAVVNNEGARLVTAIKVSDEWELQGYVEARPKTKLQYGASVQWSK